MFRDGYGTEATENRLAFCSLPPKSRRIRCYLVGFITDGSGDIVGGVITRFDSGKIQDAVISAVAAGMLLSASVFLSLLVLSGTGRRQVCIPGQIDDCGIEQAVPSQAAGMENALDRVFMIRKCLYSEITI